MPITKLKKILVQPLKILPAVFLKPIITPCLQLIENAFDDDDWEIIEHKWLEIKVENLDYSLFIGASKRQLFLTASHDIISLRPLKPDAKITGSVESYLKLLDQQVDPESLFFQRSLKISGDTELGYWFKAVLDRIERDNLPSLLKNVMVS